MQAQQFGRGPLGEAAKGSIGKLEKACRDVERRMPTPTGPEEHREQLRACQRRGTKRPESLTGTIPRGNERGDGGHPRKISLGQPLTRGLVPPSQPELQGGATIASRRERRREVRGRREAVLGPFCQGAQHSAFDRRRNSRT
jgi:hypothetical protein